MKLGDITNPKLLIAQGFLFLFALAVGCFARFYYFAFYVIEHYVDSGLASDAGARTARNPGCRQ